MGGSESKNDNQQSMEVGGQHIVNLSSNSDVVTIGVLVMATLKIMEIMIFAVRTYNRRMNRRRNTCGNCQQMKPNPAQQL